MKIKNNLKRNLSSKRINQVKTKALKSQPSLSRRNPKKRAKIIVKRKMIKKRQRRIRRIKNLIRSLIRSLP